MNERDEHEELRPPQELEVTNDLSPIAIGVAGAAGIAGALVWAAISIWTDYEIGWIAWGIGAAVGGAFHKFGGRGTVGAVLCAVIAVTSIGVGKYFAYESLVNGAYEESVVVALYDTCKEFGDQLVAAESEEKKDELIREWLTDEESETAVSDAEVAEFKSEDLSQIFDIQSGKMDRDGFKEMLTDMVRAEVPFTDTLEVFDLLWVGLGLFTAFRLARGATDETPEDADTPPDTTAPVD